MSDVEIVRLPGLLDPAFEWGSWLALLEAGPTDEVFLTPPWQRSWWQAFGRGELLVLGARRAGRLVAIAPLFADSGMVYLVGSGGSDYLDLVGDTAHPDVLPGLLERARRLTPGFLGFLFYHLPAGSPTVARLRAAAAPLGLECVCEGLLGAPRLDLGSPGAAARAASRRSLVRHARRLEREGSLLVEHLGAPEAVLPHLEAFFEQHRLRWRARGIASPFEGPAERRFYTLLAEAGAPWLRFTRLVWRERPVAFHFGFRYGGRFLWYKPSFAIDLARLSPGEVLLRELLLDSGRAGDVCFDFGLGEEPFKARFATSTRRVESWGLYPRGEPGGRR